ncbi:hypothetical protein HAX54_022190, partial [Datura stramonium]|nr:hypothetical protein [Datura stramonium]
PCRASGGLEREKRKGKSRDKLFVRMWKGIKKILKTLSPRSRMSQVASKDLLEFSFFSKFKDELVGDLTGGSDEASS